MVFFPTEKSVIGYCINLLSQLNQLNIHRSSLESQKMDSGENIEPISTHLGASSDIHGQTVTSQRFYTRQDVKTLLSI